MKLNKPYLIEWTDSAITPTLWEYRADLCDLKPVQCQTVGILLEETDDHVTLALSVSQNQVCGRICIPKCAIRKPRRLRVRAERSKP